MGVDGTTGRLTMVTEIRLSWAELKARLEGAGPPSADDALITTDGRRLGSKQEVLEFLAEEVEAARAAERQASGRAEKA